MHRGDGGDVLTSLARYWRTVRHLRPGQVVHRVVFRMARPAVDHRPAPSLRPSLRAAWLPPAENEQSLFGQTRVRLLGLEGNIDDGGWDDSAKTKLWRYNLHYFDDLTGANAAGRAPWHTELMNRWVRDNPPALGTGWEPYPTSLRIVNWVKWWVAGGDLPASCVESLAIQARWLTRRLERHLLGNHLFANAKALLFAGAAFDGPEAASWITRGTSILVTEIPEQILPDGGQFERSPMYHTLALEDVLDLRNLALAAASSGDFRLEAVGAMCAARVEPMRRWMRLMAHPDADVSFFNDTAMGIAPSPAVLEDYAMRLGYPPSAPAVDGVTLLADSGYARLENANAVVIVDVGPVGPDYLPAHAHADTLSCEFSFRGQRVLVNSGTSEYGDGPERHRQRGTSAHNTVVIDGIDSSEVWSGFRVGRRARPMAVRLARAGTIGIAAAHDGYRHLPGSLVHRRSWELDRESFSIEDTLSGVPVTAEARWHVHPDVAVGAVSPDGKSVSLQLPNGRELTLRVEGARLNVEPATWHPRFGECLPTRCVVARFGGAVVRTRVDWSA
jgi:uncharacterized heparinase superfamily protein